MDFITDRFSSFMVAAGGVDRTSNEKGEEFQTSTVGIAHESFNSNLLTDNIALIKLPKNFTLCKHCYFLFCLARIWKCSNLTKSVSFGMFLSF